MSKLYPQVIDALNETDDIKPIRSTLDRNGFYHLVASNGERRFIAAGRANTVLANNGWPKTGHNALLWVYAKSEAKGNPSSPGIRAQVRRLPSGQVQIKIPLKLGRRGNPDGNVYLVMWQGVHSKGRQQQEFNNRDDAQRYYVMLREKGRKVFLGGGSGYVYEWSGGFTEAEAGNWLDQAIYKLRKKNPVHIEQANGDPLARGIAKLERYGDSLLKLGNNSKMVAEAVRHALGNRVESAVVIADDGKGGKAYNPHPDSNKYEVIVGNIGTVYSGNNFMQASAKYATYVKQSKTGYGRAGGEDVTLMKYGEPTKEHFGTQGEYENPRACNAWPMEPYNIKGPRPFYTIKKSDVGKATIKAFGKRWRVDEFIGHIGSYDVGKRVVQTSPGVLQVENSEQLKRRVGNPHQTYWQYPWVVLLKSQSTGSVDKLTEPLSGGFNTEKQARAHMRSLKSRSLHRGRVLELLHNTVSGARVVSSKAY